jgi:uncharacterized protein with HEPN domain
MRPDDAVRVRHMLDAADAAGRFIAGRQRADLDADQMLLFAVVRAIEILGEAAGKVSEETRLLIDTVPWSHIVGMRNRLIHGYFDVDAEIVWKTVSEELPALASQLRLALR